MLKFNTILHYLCNSVKYIAEYSPALARVSSKERGVYKVILLTIFKTSCTLYYYFVSAVISGGLGAHEALNITTIFYKFFCKFAGS